MEPVGNNRYAYNLGCTGASSLFMASVLNGNAEGYAAPIDADDLSRCVFYLESYVREKGRQDLTEAEMRNLSSQSGSWLGIVNHINELRAAILNNRPVPQVNELLRMCENSGKASYSDTLSEDEKRLIQTTMQNVNTAGGWLPLKSDTNSTINRTRLFANTLIEALHAKGYQVYFDYSNPGHGCRYVTCGDAVSLVDRVDYNHRYLSLSWRPTTVRDRNTGLYQTTP